MRVDETEKVLNYGGLRLISNFMTSQTGMQIIIIHIMPNISRSKVNQTMKFSQFIKYNVRNIFFEKSCRK